MKLYLLALPDEVSVGPDGFVVGGRKPVNGLIERIAPTGTAADLAAVRGRLIAQWREMQNPQLGFEEKVQ